VLHGTVNSTVGLSINNYVRNNTVLTSEKLVRSTELTLGDGGIYKSNTSKNAYVIFTPILIRIGVYMAYF
jgi:hypothetical protein